MAITSPVPGWTIASAPIAWSFSLTALVGRPVGRALVGRSMVVLMVRPPLLISWARSATVLPSAGSAIR